MNDNLWRPAYLWLGLTLAVLPAAASEGARDYREHVMASIGGHMQSAADIVRQKVPHDDHFTVHVDGLAALAPLVGDLFPAGSEGGDALPAIWDEPEDFAARVAAFEEAAAQLKAAVDAEEDPVPAFQEVGQACKGCHDDYRED